MSPDEFALALRALDAPVFLDDRGAVTALGMEFAATTSDGKSVLVTQLSAALNARVTDPDAFVRTLMRYDYQGAGITESGHLYFLELPTRGASLAQRLAAAGPMPAAELLPIARALLDALQAPALRGDTHGMITPSSVHATTDGAVTLRWPGLMSALRAAGIDAASIAAELGIIAFVAPEVREGGRIDVRADVFALGTTLYAALTGRPPFGGRTTATMMAVVLADGGAPATTIAGTLTAMLLRAIESDPADRWHDLQQLRDALGPDVAHRPAAGAALPGRRSGCASMIAIILGGSLLLWGVSQYIS
jgi:hypothetical protein